MTATVSISDFRNNISSYLDFLSRGDVILRDEKKNLDVARITGIKQWDPTAYSQMLKKLAAKPVFSAKDHPEWATLRDVQKWLRQTRKNADRDFSYIK